MKSILLIHHGSGLGGGLVALLGLIRELKQENRITVLCIFNSEAVQFLRNENVEVIILSNNFYRKYYQLFIHSEASYFSVPNLIRNIYSMFMYFVNALFVAPAILKDLERFDIIYLNSLFLSDWAYAAKKLKVNLVVHAREPLAKGFFGVRRQIIRSVLHKYVNLIIAISEDNKQRINLLTKTVKVYDPVTSLATQEQIDDASKVEKFFVYVGGSQRIKGFEQMVYALEYLDDDIKIFFLGPFMELNEQPSLSLFIRKIFSPYLRRLPKLKTAFFSSNNVIKIGLTKEVFQYYTKSLAIISPFSKPHASLPVLESMQLGKPVISSDVNGALELLNDEFAFVFTNNNPKELALMINKMAKLPNEKIELMGSNANKKYLQIFKENPKISQLLKRLS